METNRDGQGGQKPQRRRALDELTLSPSDLNNSNQTYLDNTLHVPGFDGNDHNPLHVGNGLGEIPSSDPSSFWSIYNGTSGRSFPGHGNDAGMDFSWVGSGVSSQPVQGSSTRLGNSQQTFNIYDKFSPAMRMPSSSMQPSVLSPFTGNSQHFQANGQRPPANPGPCRDDCESQCGETGDAVCCEEDHCEDTNCKDDHCEDLCCSDDECDDAEACSDLQCSGPAHPCTDKTCADVTSDKHSLAGTDMSVDDAAAALASINDQIFPSFMGTGSAFHANSNMPASSLGGQSGVGAFDNDQFGHLPAVIANHIFECHDPHNAHPHHRPCIADNLNSVFSSGCFLPHTAADTMSGWTATAGGPDAHQANQCGAHIDNIDEFYTHVLQDHQAMFNEALYQGAVAWAAAHGNPICSHDTIGTAHHGLMQSPSFMGAVDGTSLNQQPLLITTSSHRSREPTVTSTSDSVATRSPLNAYRVADQSDEKNIKPDLWAEVDRNSMEVDDSIPHQCLWQTSPGVLCKKLFENAQQLNNHIKTEHTRNAPKDDGFHCRWWTCRRKEPFESRSKLSRHATSHSDFKPLECEVCGTRLSSQQALDQHVRTHTGESPWKCSLCPKAFKQQSALTMHLRVHTKERPLKCEICGKRFSESTNLAKHRRIHLESGNFKCKICGRIFVRLDQLRRHVVKTHKDDEGSLFLSTLMATKGISGRVTAEPETQVTSPTQRMAITTQALET